MDSRINILRIVVSVMLALAMPAVGAANAKADAGRARKVNRQSNMLEESPKPVKVEDVPVADGFPHWKGFETLLPGSARRLTPSDLRGRFVIVVCLKNGDNLLSQFVTTMKLQNYAFNADHTAVYDFARPRSDTIVVFNISDADASFAESLRKDVVVKNALKRMAFTFYRNVTFEDAPDPQGAYPFVYVVPPEGSKTIFADKAGPDICVKISKLLRKERSSQKQWHDYYGFVDEVKHVKGYDAAIAGGTSLVKIEAELKKGIVSKDIEIARESQMLYDAIEQRKGDLEFYISKEGEASPAAAIDDYDELTTRFPSMKGDARLKSLVSRASSGKDIPAVMKIYPAFRAASDVNRRSMTAAEAKKLLAVIKKAKPQLQHLAESKNINVQNVATSMQRMSDELIEKLESVLQ